LFAGTPRQEAQEQEQPTRLEVTYFFPGISEGWSFNEWPFDHFSELLGISREEYDTLVTHVTSCAIKGVRGTYRFTVTLAWDADVAKVDTLARTLYHQLRARRLPELRASIAAVELRQGLEAKAVREAAQRVGKLVSEKTAVLDRDVALKASAERVESLRTQLITARLERAVLEAQARYLRDRGEKAGRRRIEELEAKLEAFEGRGYTERHPLVAEVMRQLAAAYGLGEGNDERLIELEMKIIGLEEKMSMLERLMKEENAWGKSLLEAIDLGAAATQIDDSMASLRSTEKTLRDLRTQLEILETGKPQRIEVD
jgi:hypothetical protein